MAASKCEISRCGLCQFFSHEGRRGGTCARLDVPVSSQWKACCLAIAPFQSVSLDTTPTLLAEPIVAAGVGRSSLADVSQLDAGIKAVCSRDRSASLSDEASVSSRTSRTYKQIAKPKAAVSAKIPIERKLDP